MAKKKNPDPALEGLPPKPVKPEGFDEIPVLPVRLSPESKARLLAAGPEIERAQKEIALMKKMGMDVEVPEAELNEAILKRNIMLENFG